MLALSEHEVTCPYCGESIAVLIDVEELDQAYIEDCQVCCRPITLFPTGDTNGEVSVAVYAENETW